MRNSETETFHQDNCGMDGNPNRFGRIRSRSGHCSSASATSANTLSQSPASVGGRAAVSDTRGYPPAPATSENPGIRYHYPGRYSERSRYMGNRRIDGHDQIQCPKHRCRIRETGLGNSPQIVEPDFSGTAIKQLFDTRRLLNAAKRHPAHICQFLEMCEWHRTEPISSMGQTSLPGNTDPTARKWVQFCPPSKPLAMGRELDRGFPQESSPGWS